jgi:Fe-S-cluster-containing hydrogenase component 2
MQACPVDAIKLNLDNGSKDVYEDHCVGCKVCTIACPFGTINYNATTGKVNKCDLCAGEPQCVLACPTQAITYVDAELTGYDRMRAWASKTDNNATVAES